MKKAHDLKSETNFGSLKDNKDHLCLKLTMIEMYILSVFCSQGMPILVSESKNSDNGSSKTLTKSWNFIAGAIELISRQQIQLAKEQMMYSKAAMSKGSNQKFDEDKMKVLTEHLSKAEADYAEREEAARQAADFNTDPNERLAKKSIMLMEKIRVVPSTIMVSVRRYRIGSRRNWHGSQKITTSSMTRTGHNRGRYLTSIHKSKIIPNTIKCMPRCCWIHLQRGRCRVKFRCYHDY